MKKDVLYSTNINIRISPELKQKLDRVAKANGVRPSELIRYFIANLPEEER